MDEKTKQYLIDKYMGGRANIPAAKNIQVELEEGYEFGTKIIFGKPAHGIIKKEKDGNN